MEGGFNWFRIVFNSCFWYKWCCKLWFCCQ